MSTAATTQFVHQRIDGPGGFHLWLDGNPKITGLDGTYEQPVANAFSLVQIKDCPGSTSVCRASCYVHHLEKARPDLHAKYRHNSQTIRRILSGEGCSSLDWATTLGRYITANLQSFRWHVSGDVFSLAYANWIVQVCRRSARANHWIYTRSFDYAHVLAQAQNLAVNLSTDHENENRAPAAFRHCYMSTSNSDIPFCNQAGDVLFPDYSLRGNRVWLKTLPSDMYHGICPVDMFGKSRSIRCGVCKKCLT